MYTDDEVHDFFWSRRDSEVNPWWVRAVASCTGIMQYYYMFIFGGFMIILLIFCAIPCIKCL